jgi:hypothetical protein
MKMLIFDGWEVLLMIFAVTGVCHGFYEHGRRKGFREAEGLLVPTIKLGLMLIKEKGIQEGFESGADTVGPASTKDSSEHTCDSVAE